MKLFLFAFCSACLWAVDPSTQVVNLGNAHAVRLAKHHDLVWALLAKSDSNGGQDLEAYRL